MTTIGHKRFVRAAIGTIAAAVLVGTLAGCTAGDDDSTADETTAPEATASSEVTETPYVPEATDDGAAIISAIADCAQIGGYLGTLIDGLPLTLDAIDQATGFCQWGGEDPADTASPVVGIEINGDGSVPVPTADQVVEAGGQVIDSPAAAERNGIVYSIPVADGQAFALTAVLPDVSVSATAIGLELSEEQVGQLASAVDSILSPQ